MRIGAPFDGLAALGQELVICFPIAFPGNRRTLPFG